MKKNIIIGGGQTAAFAAKEIRSLDQNCSITIFSEEEHIPYERPPLSKSYLKDEVEFKNLEFFSKDFYTENKINFINNDKIHNVDFEKKLIYGKNDLSYPYDKLLIATGSKNRKLDFKELNNHQNILDLRNKIDCEKLKLKIRTSKKILIIGGGFIGLEVAASIKNNHNKVNIIELGNNLMGRIIPKKISDIVNEIHKEKGIDIYLNTSIDNIKYKNNIYDVSLTNGIKIKFDLIIVGIGSIPNTDIFSNKEIKIDNGIITNNFCETSVENVYAAGDVSNFFHPFYNTNIRLESYTHAQNHGICAGKNMVGVKTSYEDIPWMWSDQFDFNIQLTGMCNDYDEIYTRGSDKNAGIVLFFIKNRKVQGACGIGRKGKIGKDIKLAARLSHNKIEVEKSKIEDTTLKLNKLLR